MESKEFSIEFFFYYYEKRDFEYIEFLNKRYKVVKDSIKINLDEEIFDQDKYIAEIQLINNSPNLIKEIKEIYYFNIYFGENIANIFLKSNFSTHELIFNKEKNLCLKDINNNDIKYYDTLGNKNRRRYILINFNPKFLFINNEEINLLQFHNKINLNDSSFQYSFYDIKNKIVCWNVIKKQSSFNFLYHYNENKKKSEEFYKELKNLNLIDENYFSSKIIELYDKCQNIYFTIKLPSNLNLKSQKNY